MKKMLLGVFGYHTATFSVEEVARIFGVSVLQVQVWIEDGTLPTRRILGRTRVDHAVVRRAAQAQTMGNLFGVSASNEECIDVGNHYFR